MSDRPRLLTKEEVEAALLEEERRGSGELPAVLIEAIVEAQTVPEAPPTTVRCPACEACTLCHGEMMVSLTTAQEYNLRNRPIGHKP